MTKERPEIRRPSKSSSRGACIYIVERLYFKRPIQCLASSKILTPPHRPASVLPEEDIHSLGGEGGGGVSIFWKTPDTALYSTYVSTL
jgi:hypothetical protein